MSWLLLIALIYPLLVLAVFAWRKVDPTPSYNRWWIVSAPLPALLAGIALPDTTLQAPALMFGLVWQLNDFSRPLLLMTTSLYAIASVFGLGYLKPQALRRYTLFWLLTMFGNLVLLVAQDIASFYTGFALMTFAGYGLVVHNMSADALRAGKIYIGMAIMGEVLILAGLIAIMPDMVEPMLHYLPLALSEHSHGIWLTALLFAGFGVKAGVLGLHFWLPLAHPVAPTPASAVLSGAMIKAGLIAWMQILPLGADHGMFIDTQLFAWVVIALGLAASFLAAVFGAIQLKPKAVLAYSSISQMGLMTTLLGVALLMPQLWSGIMVALVAFAVHHGLAKGALFLGVGLATQPARLPHWAVLVLLGVPALSLIGLPLTSGGAAKYLLKDEAYQTNLSLLIFLLTFAAAATTLLMLRFIDLINGQLRVTLERTQGEARDGDGYIRNAVIAAVLVSSVAIWWFPLELSMTSAMTLTGLWETIWPMALATAIYLTVRRLQAS